MAVMKKTIGILGGMGPEATAYFFQLLIKKTGAACDQEHIPILIWNNPKIPPRTDAILHKGKSPLPLLLEGINILEKGGAGLIVVPCITAHYYGPKLQARAKVPFVNLLDESLGYTKKYFPGIKKAGLVASSGTVASRLFHKTFEQAGIEVIAPGQDEQKRVQNAIFGKKGITAGFTTGAPRKTIIAAARCLIRRGAEAIIAGCTEVPLVLEPKDIFVPFIEPMKIGALACIKMAGYRIKE
jgi:aspartate racemase